MPAAINPDVLTEKICMCPRFPLVWQLSGRLLARLPVSLLNTKPPLSVCSADVITRLEMEMKDSARQR